MRAHEGERGSALVEALVAIGILAVTLGAVTQAVGQGALRTRAAEQARAAALEARSRLAEVGGDIALAPGRSSGLDGDLAWRVDIAPESGGASGQLLSVTVEAGPRTGPPAATLRSLRVAPAA